MTHSTDHTIPYHTIPENASTALGGGAAVPQAQHQPRRWSTVMLLVAGEQKVIAQTWLLGTIFTNQELCGFLVKNKVPF